MVVCGEVLKNQLIVQIFLLLGFFLTLFFFFHHSPEAGV